MYQRQPEWVEVRMALAPLLEVAGAPAVARDLAGQRPNEQRVTIEAPEERHERVARPADPGCAPQGDGVVITEPRQKFHEGARQWFAGESPAARRGAVVL